MLFVNRSKAARLSVPIFIIEMDSSVVSETIAACVVDVVQVLRPCRRPGRYYSFGLIIVTMKTVQHPPPPPPPTPAPGRRLPSRPVPNTLGR